MPHDVDSGRGLQNRIRDGEAEHCVSGVRNECSVIVDAVSVDGDPDGVPPISARYPGWGILLPRRIAWMSIPSSPTGAGWSSPMSCSVGESELWASPFGVLGHMCYS